jgi:DNA-binding protein H-NS
MATLAALKRQLAKLEADVARKTKEELSGAIAKVRSIMSEFGVTIEHLTSAAGKKASTKAASKGAAYKKAARPSAKKTASKRVGAGVPKYQDPKTGATWTGMGKPPSWLAGAKSRDAFLIVKPAAAETPAAPKKAASAKKTARKAATKVAAPAKKAVKAAAKKVTTVAKKAATKPAAAKKAVTAKAAPKKATAAKTTPKKAPAKKAAPAVVEPSAPVAAE